MQVGGVVLCGGESKRMGRSKALLPFGRETMLQRVASVLQDHSHADRLRDVDGVAGEFQLAAFRIDAKYVHVV